MTSESPGGCPRRPPHLLPPARDPPAHTLPAPLPHHHPTSPWSVDLCQPCRAQAWQWPHIPRAAARSQCCRAAAADGRTCQTQTASLEDQTGPRARQLGGWMQLWARSQASRRKLPLQLVRCGWTLVRAGGGAIPPALPGAPPLEGCLQGLCLLTPSRCKPGACGDAIEARHLATSHIECETWLPAAPLSEAARQVPLSTACMRCTLFNTRQPHLMQVPEAPERWH